MTEARNEAVEAVNEQSTQPSDLTTKWQERVYGWSESGLSKSAYCKREGVNYHQMIYWSRKLSPASSESRKARQRKSPSPVSNGFVAVSVSPVGTPGGLFLRLPNGIEIYGVQEQFIGRVLEQISQQ